MQGTVVDSKYQIVRRLGQGGMGAVYEARHLGTGRRVALKVIVPEALLGGDRDIIPRFQREARASGAIDSQHVVQVLDTGVDPQTNTPYLVMEHLTGEDVQQLVRRVGPLAPDVVLRIMAQACSGLSRAHQEGIVHRDIKAANLFVARREAGELVVKILDFGIAKVRADPMAASAHHGITRTGSMLGSPLYMPPEQVTGTKDVDPRADIFSLGVTMYEALCGVTPNHECETIGTLILAICSGKGQPIQQRAPWVPRGVAAIVEKALALEPSARFQTTAEMHAAITALLPQGASLNESMLVGASPGLESTVAMPLAQTPGEALPSAVGGPDWVAAPAFTPSLPQSSPALPSPAVASTATAFTGTRPGTSQSRARWVLAPPLALLVLCGAGFGIYKLRLSAATSAAGSSAAMTPPPPDASAPASVAADATSPVDGGAAPAAIDARDASTSMPGAPAPTQVGVMASARPRVAPPPAAKPPVNCNPNFYYDHDVKRFKEECL